MFYINYVLNFKLKETTSFLKTMCQFNNISQFLWAQMQKDFKAEA